MMYGLGGNGCLENNMQLTVKGFPGTSSSLADYVKPLVRKNQDVFLALHIGTNDLSNNYSSDNLQRIIKSLTFKCIMYTKWSHFRKKNVDLLLKNRSTCSNTLYVLCINVLASLNTGNSSIITFV